MRQQYCALRERQWRAISYEVPARLAEDDPKILAMKRQLARLRGERVNEYRHVLCAVTYKTAWFRSHNTEIVLPMME